MKTKGSRMSNQIPPVPVNLLNINTNQDQVWKKINARFNGHPDFYPLTIKAAYVIELIYDICSAAETLIVNQSIRYILGFGVFATGIELLGRCLLGIRNISGESSNCLRTGFRWLVNPDINSTDNTIIVIDHPMATYNVEELVLLRHFVLHGQATSQALAWNLDPNLMVYFPELIANGIDHYWSGLTGVNGEGLQECLCERLANANIIAVHGPKPVADIWRKFSQGSAGQEFRKLNYSLVIPR